MKKFGGVEMELTLVGISRDALISLRTYHCQYTTLIPGVISQGDGTDHQSPGRDIGYRQ